MANWKKQEVRAEIVRLETIERKLLAERRALTSDELKILHDLQHYRSIWACQFSNR